MKERKIRPSVVYCILNIITNERYVGSTTNFSDRKGDHLYTLRHNKHRNYKLQDSFNTHGESNFKFFVLEEVPTWDKNFLEEREQHWIDKYKPEYNLNPVAGNYFNSTAYSKEARQKQILAVTGRKQSQEEKDKRAKSIREYWQRPENRGKLKLSEEKKKHLSEINMGDKNPNFGKPRSEETKNKSSLSNSKVLYTFQSPDGRVVEFTGLKRNSENILGFPEYFARRLISGAKKEYNGWIFVKSEKIAPSKEIGA